MDAFSFDQRFARFVAQVETDAIRRGTALYQAGHASVGSIGDDAVAGDVEGFATRLVMDRGGGMAGNCACAEFFNCAHSYALARAARDRLIGAKPKPEPAAIYPSALSELEERFEDSMDRELKKLADELNRLWLRAKESGFSLYPRDLQPILLARTGALPEREPVRALKRILDARPPESPLALADAIRAYCDSRGIAVAKDFERATRPSDHVSQVVEYDRTREREQRPVELVYELRLEPTAERDWFQLSSSARAIGDEAYTREEVAKLIEARGGLAKLEGKGWRRAAPPADARLQGVLLDYGVDPVRGNTQRVHATQLIDIADAAPKGDAVWQAALDQGRAYLDTPLPDPPEAVAGILRPYQVDGFKFLCSLSERGLGGLLADDMGLGKTLQAIAWLMWLGARAASKGGLRALVVCPKSVMENWVREPDKFGSGLRIAAFRSDRIDDAALAEANVVVANYAQLRLAADFFLGQRWDAAILDEGQNIKNPSSQTAKTAIRLDATHRLVLTGTPIENRLMDLWSLMRFAMPRLLGPQAAFATNYNPDRNPDALGSLRRRVRPFMLRRLKSEVARDLPERIEEDILCELEGEQAALYAAELERARGALREATGSGPAGLNALQALLRLRQVCDDPRLLGWDAPEGFVSAKLQALLDILEPILAEGHKALVFSQFVEMLEILRRELDARELPSLMLTGKTRDRQSLIDRFQSPEGEGIFLLSLKAAGSGLNLTAASYVVLFDPWWNPAVEAQAIDRAHRIGQGSQVIAYRILAKGTVEEKIRALQREKSDLADALGLETLSAILE